MNFETRKHPTLDIECSNNGLYRKFGKGEWKAGSRDLNGYMNSSYGYVHRLVFECFNHIIDDKKEVHHIDANPSNNNVTNLQQTDRSGQMKARNNDFLKTLPRKKREVIATNSKTNETMSFKSQNQAGLFFQKSAGSIFKCCTGSMTGINDWTFKHCVV